MLLLTLVLLAHFLVLLVFLRTEFYHMKHCCCHCCSSSPWQVAEILEEVESERIAGLLHQCFSGDGVVGWLRSSVGSSPAHLGLVV